MCRVAGVRNGTGCGTLLGDPVAAHGVNSAVLKISCMDCGSHQRMRMDRTYFRTDLRQQISLCVVLDGKMRGHMSDVKQAHSAYPKMESTKVFPGNVAVLFSVQTAMATAMRQVSNQGE